MLTIDIVTKIIFVGLMLFFLFSLAQVVYYFRRMMHYKRKSDQLRTEIFKKYGVWIDAPPPL